MPSPSVQALGSARAASAEWSSHGALHLTVAVKHAYRIRPGGVMVPEPASPVRPDELAPYLSHADVLFFGHAHLPRAVKAVTVRLGLFREQVLVDKAVAVYGEEPFTTRPLPELGPRRQLAPPFTVSDDIDWKTFQLAPPDQQCAFLRGDEWLLLEGLSPLAVVLRSRLPGAYARARVRLAGQSGAREIAMWADTLVIDGDASRCTVLWRGNLEFEARRVLEQAELWAGVGHTGEPIVWPAAAELALDDGTSPERPVAQVAASEGTVSLGEAFAAEVSATPFEQTEGEAVVLSDVFEEPPAAAAGGTVSLSDAVASDAATPFEDAGGTVSLSDAFASDAATPFEDEGGTVSLSDAFASDAATPFEPGGTVALGDAFAPESGTPFEEGTVALSDVFETNAATPFDGTAPIEPPPPSTALEATDTGTVTLSAALHAEAATRAATPFAPLGPAAIPGSPWVTRPPAVAARPRGDAQVSHHLGDRAFAAPVAAADAPAASHFFHRLQRPAAAAHSDAPVVELPPRVSDAVPVHAGTPLRAVVVKGSLRPPKPSLTVVVKGSFDLVVGEAARLRPVCDVPSGDLPEPPLLGETGTIGYASDLAPFKAQADVVLVGHAHPPAGEPTACQVRFRFGTLGNRFDRKLAVFGERWWKPGITTSMTAPARFDSVELNWNNAFGGAADTRNPAGIGEAPGEDGVHRLPRLEDPAHLIGSPSHRPRPICFAPIPATWHERWRHLGTYDRAWRKKRWPYQPADFDWHFHQSAPPEQRLEHLHGDEPYAITGMSSVHSHIAGTLPGIRARAFAKQTDGDLTEIALHLDTAVFDTDTLAVHLVWRGLLEVEDHDARDVALVYVIHESLDDAPATLEDVSRMLDVSLMPLQQVEATLEQETTPANDVEEAPDAGDEVFDSTDGMAAEQAELEDAIEHQLGELQRQVDEARANAGLSPIDLKNAPAPDPPDASALVGRMRQAGMADEHIAGVFGSMAGVPAALGMSETKAANVTLGNADMRQILKTAGVPEEQLAALTTAFPDDPPEPETSPVRDVPEAEPAQHDEDKSIREQVIALLATEQTFDGAELAGADLHDVDFMERSLRGAVLVGCNLRGCTFDGCDLSEALLSGSDLSQGSLAGARLDGADLSGAILAEASLQGASLAGADLQRVAAVKADFRGVSGLRIQLADSDLTGANFEGAQAPSIDLSRCKLDDAVFDEAMMSRVRFYGAAGKGVRFAGADLSDARADGVSLPKANFQQSRAEGSVWERADLTGATFHSCMLDRASFVRASCERAIFSAASMRAGRLDGCKLAGAALLHADLMKASLQGADLTGADLRGANLFAVDTWRAVVHKTLLDGANLAKSSLGDKT